jgi:photosystem II stability/assembly factor-like uncharacterized protein
MSNVKLRLLIAVLLVLAASPLAAQSGKQKPAAQRPAAPAVPTPAAPAPGLKVTASMLMALKGRSIGPAVMSGRVSDLALDPGNPFVFYVAMGTSGVMKTSDNGGTFSGIFAEQPVAAVGAVAVAPSDPKIVWVGTGEANDRNSSSWGNGVYRSDDSGSTWTRAGLADSKTIARVVVHPREPKTAWVAAMGDLWVPSAERGLYKTTDGGKTWKAVLQAAAPYTNRVGCGEVAIDPSNPDVVYAVLYARQRTPWSFVAGPDATDGKDLGGIFKSTDGGATWKKLDKGLPDQTGRIGLAVYARDPKIVYALVQSAEGGTANIDDVRSKRGGVFRSEDAGESWTRMNPLDPRPFYFSQIRVDPTNDQRVYVLGFMLHVSEDGGKSFREDRFKNVHSDCHALAIDPRNAERLVLGTDGGPYQSFDGGSHWDLLNKFAAGEFYRVATDFSAPYRVCGGLQDNSNWVGPSMTRSKEGITNSDWIEVAGGDGFYCVFDETDPSVIYTESQGGELYRFNMKNGEVKPLRPEPAEGQPAFRFHWVAPLIPSVHQKGVMYLAGNRVFQLAARGEQWKAISPDLSARDVNKIMTTGSGAETFGVVYTLAESPVKAGLFWAGTDDGKVWITEDGGGNWTDLTANLPGAVKGQWISRIEAGHFDAQVAYLAVDAHRTGNYAPLAYRTADAGKTWQTVAGNLPTDQPVKLVREDVKNPNLLFAGTEFGLFLSVDRGAQWVRLPDFPTVAVDDIAIQPRELDLVVATHGLSLFIVDDIKPLEEMTPEVLGREGYLFAPRPAFGFNPLPGWAEESGTTVYRGANPPPGAILNVYLREYTGAEIKVAISNAAGTPVANLSAPGTPGVNRLVWDLKPTKDVLNEYGGEGQRFVRPGEYTVTLTYGKAKQTQKLKVEIAEGLETR